MLMTSPATLALLTALACGAWAQTQSTKTPAASQVIGEVTALDAPTGQISLKTDKGEAVVVTIGGSTTFRRVPPGAQDLTRATRIELSDLGVGDRVLAIGQPSEDRKRIEARSVIAMSPYDLT